MILISHIMGVALLSVTWFHNGEPVTEPMELFTFDSMEECYEFGSNVIEHMKADKAALQELIALTPGADAVGITCTNQVDEVSM